MANEFLLSEYADLVALEKQTETILKAFDAIETRAAAVGLTLKNSLTATGDGTGMQALIAGMIAADTNTKNYANTVRSLGNDIKVLADLQKAQSSAQSIAVKQAQLDLIELKKRNQELTIAAKEQLAADRLIAQAAKDKSIAEKQAAADSVAAGRERILQLRREQAQIEKLEEAERQRAGAEQAALSGTYNPGGGKGNGPSQGFTPQALSVMQGNILLVKQYQSAIANLTAEQKADLAAFKKGEISQAEYQQRVVLSTEKVNGYKSSVSALNREMKLSNAVNDAERNSLARAQALILQYTNEKKQLNLATAEGVRLNQNYNKAIASTNAFILKNADGETQRVKNIGNYSTALTGYVSVLRGMRGPTKLLGEALGIGAYQADQLRLILEHSLQGVAAYVRAKRDSTAAVEAESIANGTHITTQELLILSETQLAEANLSLTTATKATTAAELNLAEAQAATAAAAEIEALAQADLAATIAGSTEFTAAEALAQSALSEAQIAVAAATLTENLASIQLTASQLVSTIATEEQTAAQIAFAAATATATGATTGLSSVLKFSGIGLAVAAIGYLIYKIVEYTKAAKKAGEMGRILKEVNEDTAKAAGKEAGSMVVLRAEIENTLIPMNKRLQAIKNLRDEFPDLLKNVTDEALLNGKAAKSYEVLAAAIVKKAQAEAAEAKIQDLVSKNQDISLAAQQKFEDVNKKIANTKADASISSGGTGGGGGNYGGATKVAKQKALADEYDDQNKADKKLIALNNDKINFLLKFAAVEDNITDGKGKKTKKGANSKESTKSLLDSDFEAFKIAQLEKIKLLDDEVKNEKLSYVLRLTDLTDYSKAKRDLINAQATDNIRQENDKELALQDNLKTARGNAAKNILIDLANVNTKISNIKKQQGVDLRAVDRENAKQMEEITKQQGDEELKIQKANYDRALLFVEDKHNKEKEVNTIAYTESLESLQKSLDEGLISEEEYNIRRAKLEFDYAITSIQIEIKRIKTLIALRALLGQDVSKELLKIAELEKKIADDSVANTKKAEEAKKNLKIENITKAFNKIKEYSDKTFSIINGLMNISATSQKNALKEQSDAAEIKAARDIEIVNASSASEQDKAAKTIIINARLAAQKEAIAKKQKEADYKAAQLNKAEAEFNIILSTAQAVMAALAKGNKFEAIAAGVTGAAELAIAIATPIPKFKTGLQKDYEGYGIVGDGGRSEAIIRKDGSVEITPDTDTLTFLNKGDRILPDLKDLQNIAMAGMGRVTNPSQNISLSAMLAKSIAQSENQQRINQQLLTTIANKREVHLSASEGGLAAMWTHGANITSYIDEQCNF